MPKTEKNGVEQEVTETTASNSIKINGEEFSLDNASDTAKQALNSLQFAERKITQLRGERGSSTFSKMS
jgi:hypothetical protein